MTHFLLGLVEHYGYLIVLVGVGLESLGVPVPGETVLVIGAVAAAQGHLSPWGVAAAGLSGAVIGDNTGYWIGREWGRRLIAAPGIRRVYDPDRLARAERLFERRGWIAVFFGRFVALLRIFAGPLAGLHRMRWTHFVVANVAGGACWVTAVTVVGLVVGSNLDRGIRVVTRAGYAGLALTVLAGIGVAVWHRRRRGRSPGRPP